MKRPKLLAVTLAAALLAGCGQSAVPATAETADADVWHWEAQTVDLQGASAVGDILCGADGTVQLCLYDKSNDKYRMLQSTDSGETWTTDSLSWMNGLLDREEEIRYAMRSPEGIWLVGVGPKWWNDEGKVQFWMGPEDELTPWKVSDLVPDREGMVVSAFLGDGRLAFVPADPDLGMGSDLVVYDPATGSCTTVPGVGEKAYSYWHEEKGNAGDWTARGGIFAQCGVGSRYVYMTYDTDGIQLRAIDPDSGTDTVLLEDVPGGAVAAMTGLSDGTLYFLNREGIWRLAEGGTLPELVVEIAGLDLDNQTPNEWIFACLGCAADGSFLVLTHDSYGANDLTRYVMTSE